MQLTTSMKIPRCMAAVPAAAFLGIAAILALTGCNKTVESIIPTTIPTEQTVAGLPPDGTVSLTETFVGGVGGGKGVLSYHARNIPSYWWAPSWGPAVFPRSKPKARSTSSTASRNFQPSAQAKRAVGLETAGASDLWLESERGVVMHLTGTQAGVTLSLGRDEILIKMTH